MSCSRCGEDERPLNELLVLQLRGEYPNVRNNISGCKVFGTYWNQEKKTILGGAEDTPHMGNNNIQVLGKWTHGVALEKGKPYLIDSGG